MPPGAGDDVDGEATAVLALAVGVEPADGLVLPRATADVDPHAVKINRLTTASARTLL
jgi:hypothetical protein